MTKIASYNVDGEDCPEGGLDIRAQHALPAWRNFFKRHFEDVHKYDLRVLNSCTCIGSDPEDAREEVARDALKQLNFMKETLGYKVTLVPGFSVEDYKSP